MPQTMSNSRMGLSGELLSSSDSTKTLHLQLLATFLSLNVAESTFSKNDLNGKFVCL